MLHGEFGVRVRPWAVLAVCLATAVGGTARANGRFPAAQYALVGPGASADTLVVRTTFGVLSSVDGGAHWLWLCEDLLGYGSTVTWDPPLALGSRGTDGVPLLVGLTDGVARTLDGCTVTPVPELGRSYSGDLTADATGTRVLWVASDNPGPNRLWVSTDGGRSFSPHGTADPGVLLETVETSDADPLRVYMTGSVPSAVGGAARWVLYRSMDGGDTVQTVPLDLHGGTDAWLAGTDPTRADVVYLRTRVDTGDGGMGGTLLLRSENGGAGFTVVTRTVGAMLGVAVSGDGSTVWAGGPDPADGLQRSDDAGRHFHRVADAHVACLRWHAGVLYVCGDNAVDGYTLGRWDNALAGVRPVMRLADIQGPPVCATATAGTRACDQRWASVQASLGVSRQAMDAGRTPAPPGAPSTGCACGVSPTGGHGGAWALGMALGATLGVHARRRRKLADGAPGCVRSHL